MTVFKRFRAAASIAAAGLLCAAVAQAQEAPAEREALETAYDAAFADTFKDPANLDKTFRFAEVAVEAGDIEGAIGALERMLIYNPDLPRVRLELGVLYFRLGSYQIARSYLVRAVEPEEVPEAVRERVQVYLSEIDKRLKRHRFSGSIYGGIRWQSNANSGPTSTGVLAFGVPVTLATAFTKQSDSNLFLAGNLRHVFDFQTQGGETWESEGLAFGARQRDETQLNLALIELKTGPRGQFVREKIGAIGYRPYVVGSIVTLENDRYLSTLGGGLTLSREFGERAAAEVNYEHRRRVFRNSGRRPTASLQTGNEDGVRLTVRYVARPWASLRLSGWWRNEGATSEVFGNREWAISPSVTVNYEAPGRIKGRWTSSLSAAWIARHYHEINPIIDPTNRRIDRERRFQLLTSAPLWKTFSLIGTAQRVVVDSSLPNFEFDNTSVSLGVSYRF